VNGFEVLEVEITSGEFFIRSRVAYFRFKCMEFLGIPEIELVLQNGRAGIAVLVRNRVVHRRLRLAVGFDDYFPPLLRGEILAFRYCRAALHVRGINDAFDSAYLLESGAANDKA
jgi:hypothetical protein